MSHVDGTDDGWGYGVIGSNDSREYGYGVLGLSALSVQGVGVVGRSRRMAVLGQANDTFGMGVNGENPFGFAGVGVQGISGGDWGVSMYGLSNKGFGVYGHALLSGVVGSTERGYGVLGWSLGRGVGVYGFSNTEEGYAAYLDGKVYIRGPLEKPAGSFKIDHPLDPANKYLCHSFVESPDMKNVYDGVVALDDKGEAEVELPDWFGALNMDFRYQLTAIGSPGPNLYIAEEISDTSTNDSSNSSNNSNKSSFKIAGGISGMKVSWQVTGIRKDPWANAHRIQVEEDKPDKEQGYYMYPDLYGQPEEKGISRLLFPEEKKQELLINENKLT